MNIYFVLIFCLVLSFYGVINYYIGLRLWQSIGSLLSYLPPAAYWTVFFIIAYSYILGRMGARYLPRAISEGLSIAGAYWMGFMFYFLLIIAAVDFLRFAAGLTGIVSRAAVRSLWTFPQTGLFVILLVGSIFAYGFYNARNPGVSYYDITIPKVSGTIAEMNAVLVSDIHLGKIVGRKSLAHMVDMINSLEPDIVFLGGDIIDDNVEPYVEQGMSEEFGRLKPRYGIYAALGNHEYYGGHVEEITEELNKAGVIVLRDRYIQLEDSIYVVGREDRDSRRILGRERMNLKDILEGVNTALPVILLDHNPAKLEEAKDAGVDLQLSGHTHRGQLFPNHLITGRIFEIDWGYLKEENLQVIVSSGFGTWGVPIRVGADPEIVSIKIKFKQ